MKWDVVFLTRRREDSDRDLKERPNLRVEKPTGREGRLAKRGLFQGKTKVSIHLSGNDKSNEARTLISISALCSSFLKMLYPFRDTVAREYPSYL